MFLFKIYDYIFKTVNDKHQPPNYPTSGYTIFEYVKYTNDNVKIF